MAVTPLDLNGLTRFAAVVEGGGFSPAARALGLPRQSVHRSVAALERAAGVALLERRGGRVRPTDAGQRLFGHAMTILAEARAARANLAAVRDRPHGRLRLTAPHLFAEEFLTRPMEEFLTAWPDVQIDADLTVARRELARVDLDLAFRIGARPQEEGLYTVAIGEVATDCFAAPLYLARTGAIDDPRDVIGRAAIAYGPARRRYTWRFTRGDTVRAVEVEPRLRADSARIALSACRAAIGIAALPSFVCAADVARGDLGVVLPEWRLPSFPVWAMSAVRISRNVMLRTFVDLVRARLAQTAR